MSVLARSGAISPAVRVLKVLLQVFGNTAAVYLSSLLHVFQLESFLVCMKQKWCHANVSGQLCGSVLTLCTCVRVCLCMLPGCKLSSCFSNQSSVFSC